MNRPELVTAKELRPAEKSRIRWRVDRISAAAKCSQRFIRSEQLLIHSETASEVELRAALIVRYIDEAPQICTWAQAFARPAYSWRCPCRQAATCWPQ